MLFALAEIALMRKIWSSIIKSWVFSNCIITLVPITMSLVFNKMTKIDIEIIILFILFIIFTYFQNTFEWRLLQRTRKNIFSGQQGRDELNAILLRIKSYLLSNGALDLLKPKHFHLQSFTKALNSTQRVDVELWVNVNWSTQLYRILNVL